MRNCFDMDKSTDMKRIMKRLGAEIRAAREYRMRRDPLMWTQEKLGQMIGRDQQSISNYERGMVFPQARELFLLARILDLSLDEILLGRPKQRPPEYTTPRRLLREILEGEEEVISGLRDQGEVRVSPATASSILKKAGIIIDLKKFIHRIDKAE